jgi:hypothetical protein
MSGLPTMSADIQKRSRRSTDLIPATQTDSCERSLEEVIEFHDKGGNARRPRWLPRLVPLHLSAKDKQDLVAFLKTSTSVDKAVEIPIIPR